MINSWKALWINKGCWYCRMKGPMPWWQYLMLYSKFTGNSEPGKVTYPSLLDWHSQLSHLLFQSRENTKWKCFYQSLLKIHRAAKSRTLGVFKMRTIFFVTNQFILKQILRFWFVNFPDNRMPTKINRQKNKKKKRRSSLILLTSSEMSAKQNCMSKWASASLTYWRQPVSIWAVAIASPKDWLLLFYFGWWS